MTLTAEHKQTIRASLILGIAAVLATLIPISVWLHFDPVIDHGSIYFACIVFPLIIAPSCAYRQIRARLRAERLAAENYRLANSDELTGLPNRRAFFKAAAALQVRAAAGEGVLICAIADIDSFKRVNDDFGHDAGDSVLKTVGSLMHAMAPAKGLMARLGGEEFAFASLFSSESAGRAYCDALVAAVRHKDCAFGDMHICVTISLGFTAEQPGDTVSAMLSRADHALYRAKNAGKDRAVNFAADPRRRGPQPMAV